MIHLLKDKLKPNFVYNHWIYDYYDSIYIENRQDIDCFKMLFLVKFKVYYNFINDNNDINYVTTSDCLNLIKIRDTLNKFNDTIVHKNYIPIEKPPSDHLTFQIVIWLVFSIVLLILIMIYVQCFFKNKNNKISLTKNKIVAVSNNSNSFELQFKIEAYIQETNDLDEILNLD